MGDKKTRVLIIEHNVEYSSMLKMVLSKSDDVKFDVTLHNNLQSALSELENNNIDLLLLDLDLPDSSGLDTFNKISESASSLPVIILTGNDDGN
ncbi:MAG: response regulator [Candidatus Dadabacteria bacterium]|nr:response regulator transcription factor [Candidatus Dadabacteria bacterium]NIY22895.1 response regulator [Candidatus Dadabacteria bacterium]